MIKLDRKLINKMKYTLNNIEGLEFVALIGSLAERGETYHDLDIAIKTDKRNKYPILCKVIQDLSRELSIKEEQIDVIDLDRADLELKKEVITKGQILLDRIGYKEKLIEELNAKYAEYNEFQKICINEWINSADPSTIDVNIIKRRMDFIKSETAFLKENILDKSIEEVEKSPILKRLIERSFHLILEAILDICRHIVSSMGWGPALSYSEFVELCHEHNVIDKKLKEEIIREIRLRNIIIHRYLEIDYRKLYEESEKLEGIVKEFERQILSFIRKLE